MSIYVVTLRKETNYSEKRISIDDYDEEVELIDDLEAQLDFIEQMDEESLI